MFKVYLLIASLILILVPPLSWADPVIIPMKSISIDLNNKARLQRGAKLFMNYCSGCHSLKYMRYNQMALDLGLTTFDGDVDEDLLKNNLIFTKEVVHAPIQVALLAEDAKQWFGMVPPDLSLSGRSRGPLWLYNYLQGFYTDNTRPFGTNNLLVPDVAMPNVLEPLLGKTVLIKGESEPYLLLVKHGEMYQKEFDSALQDLVTFLVYVGEPAKLVRYRIGMFVIMFLGLFFVVAYKLKKTYWSQFHH